MDGNKGGEEAPPNVKKQEIEQAEELLENAVEAQAIPREKDSVQAKEEVFLRVYDLSRGMAKQFSKQMLGFEIEGVWHTSLELYGNEYFFQSGLFYQPAGTTFYEPCVQRISMGKTVCAVKDLHDFIELARPNWSHETYDLFENNCNNFSDTLAYFLLDKGIPAHILELPAKVKETDFYKNFMGKNNAARK